MPAVGVARGAGHGESCPHPGQLHLWCFRLDERHDRLAKTLSPGELARAARLRKPAERRRFAVAHAARREILARYLGVAPAELRFAASEFGKPELAEPAVALRFNVAASGHLGLLVVRAGGEVGVDLERIRLDFDWQPLAADFYTWAENRALQSLTGDAGTAAFFRCWTRKEAYVKARGDGLALPLDGFEVSVDGAPRVEWVADWWIRELDAAPGYAAAVAGDGDVPSLTCRRWGR